MRGRGRIGIGTQSAGSGQIQSTMKRTTGRRAGLRRRPYERLGDARGEWRGGGRGASERGFQAARSLGHKARTGCVEEAG